MYEPHEPYVMNVNEKPEFFNRGDFRAGKGRFDTHQCRQTAFTVTVRLELSNVWSIRLR